MELKEVFQVLDRNLQNTNQKLGFKKVNESDTSAEYAGDKGVYRFVYDGENKIMSFECAYGEEKGAEYNTIARNLLDLGNTDEREAKSLSNEMIEEVERLFHSKKQVDLNKVKMPKAVSKSKAKSGLISYDVDTLANRFGGVFPQAKDEIKKNIVAYGEFLPETFFKEYGNALVLDVIQNGSDAERKKLFKMLCDVYEDGTNEVQDIIGVTILGEMKNDPEMMAIADAYMSEYMAGPVHEINKLTAKNNRFTKRLANPPAYKPKKKKAFNPTNALGDMAERR